MNGLKFVTGIQLQIAGWGMWMPVSLPCVLLQHEALRRMVRAERATLASLGAEHRGLDSFLWN